MPSWTPRELSAPWKPGRSPMRSFPSCCQWPPVGSLHIACEGIQSQGMPVGREVFETCFNIGEYRHIARVAAIPFFIYPRQEVRPVYLRLQAVRGCRTPQSVDDALRRRQERGTAESTEGDTDRRSAFAVAVYHADLLRAKVVNW